MGKIFDNSDPPPGERFTLLALADHADDSGRCFPSIARLAKGTGYSERAIQGHLKTLERRGVVKVAKGAGPNGVNVFAISLAPADFAPPQILRDTPADSAPKPSGTTKEPSDISSKNLLKV
ncbi:helix-turn-helix domain-containing protein [Paracoccus bogoriensis]|uniref:helix-turn-helix domain-containing protein n=1 Tax=Paracoccus bogoriensis TaxID=242065 RepID=UPI001C6671E5|nr:helix-turn-helix domain-containing protein [Paracoccus bogoriensis]MBW7055751.1 helix-turn-helix domain-containing protein [Paracoccus bogoriensis]